MRYFLVPGVLAKPGSIRNVRALTGVPSFRLYACSRRLNSTINVMSAKFAAPVARQGAREGYFRAVKCGSERCSESEPESI